jgi:hypothetical protein
LRLKKELKD